jgi:hypothetical protein
LIGLVSPRLADSVGGIKARTSKSGTKRISAEVTVGGLSQQQGLTGARGSGVGIGSLLFCSVASGQQQHLLCCTGAPCFSAGSCLPQQDAGDTMQHHPDGSATKRLDSKASNRVILPIARMVNWSE